MRQNKTGQLAKFPIQLTDEKFNQLYVVLEITEDDEKPRAEMKSSNRGLSFSPILAVKLDLFEVLEADTTDIFVHQGTISNTCHSQATGKVVKVNEKKIMLNLTKGLKGLQKNIYLNVKTSKNIQKLVLQNNNQSYESRNISNRRTN
jgi:hypothetical protein